jgi:hypothetical protein
LLRSEAPGLVLRHERGGRLFNAGDITHHVSRAIFAELDRGFATRFGQFNGKPHQRRGPMAP